MNRRQFIKETAALGLSAAVGKAALGEPSRAEGAPAAASIPTGPNPRMSGRAQAEWRWYAPPYSLPKGVHLFADWRYVDPGYLDWLSADGKKLTRTGSGESLEPGLYVDAYASHAGVPQGVAIRTQPADIGEPLKGVMAGSIAYEGGLYRMWYGIWSEDCWFVPELAEKDPAAMDRIRQRWETLMLYAESRDGTDWKIPSLDLIDPREYAGNEVVFRNAVFGRGQVTSGGAKAQSWKGPAVFIDPIGPAEERYKMIYGARFGGRKGGGNETAHRMFADYRRRWPADEDIDPFVVDFLTRSNVLTCLMGATSSDGLRWKTISEPLALHLTDSNHAISYDPLIGKYVWYNRRDWVYGRRRGIGRSESGNFRHFPLPDMVIQPDIEGGPDVDWYTPCKTIYPGTVDQHLLFSTQFKRDDETGVIDLFSSPDGIHWNPVPGGPVVVGGPLGHPHDSWLRYCSDLVPLPGDRVGIMASAQLKPHKFPRRAGRRSREEFGHSSFWASWPKGRLTALVAPGTGSFSTVGLNLAGRTLVLNLEAKTAGEVRVEIARRGEGYAQGDALPGRSFADCDPMHGDFPSHTVTWRGQADLGFAEGEPVVLRFRLRMAKLYSFEVV